ERLDRCLERLHDYFIRGGEPLAIRKRCAIVDYRYVKSEHRAERAQRNRDMSRANDYQSLCADDRIDKQSRTAANIEMRDRLQPPRSIDLEQRGNRVGGSRDNLRKRRCGQRE